MNSVSVIVCCLCDCWWWVFIRFPLTFIYLWCCLDLWYDMDTKQHWWSLLFIVFHISYL